MADASATAPTSSSPEARSSSSSSSSSASSSSSSGTADSSDDGMEAELMAAMVASDDDGGVEAAAADVTGQQHPQHVAAAKTAAHEQANREGGFKRRRVLKKQAGGGGGAGSSGGGVSGLGSEGEGEGHALCPPHPAFMLGMCVRCQMPKAQADLQEGNLSSDSLRLKYLPGDFELSRAEAERLREERNQHLDSTNKLSLVLDLDHTLLNSMRSLKMPEKQAEEFEAWLRHDDMAGPEKKMLYKLPHMHMWTKLRPFVREFLEAANEMFQLYIYTMGDRAYALEMASILDPGRKYFDGPERIIGRSDGTAKHQKSLDIVLVGEEKVLILDDTEGVWPEHRSNLLRIERYLFLPNAPEHFGLRCPALMTLQRDEAVEGGALATILGVLKQVHKRYFEAPKGEQDVRRGLSEVKLTVLSGCSLVMSRAFPPTHHLWRLAEELGALCVTETDESATHVVAGVAGTEKAKWAEKRGKHVVNPRWIEASAHLWVKADEAQFPVEAAVNYDMPSTEEDVKHSLEAAAGG